ncbi:hypothetical protein L1987_43721 [Smallanthus sonchifolius]|uniref:Uncharacterized protein n=1 Tax=Smallanthus sonchifolius TaxID=185202 RepID=A0ACB9GMA5_9ASTR|nr:hypothetical protein L1987_43721 [Smallanthus sonchifolius]
MESTTIFLLFSSFSLFLQLEASRPINPHISVMGKVFCDTCANKSYSHTYLLSGAEVRIDCKFNAVSPRTAEQISFSINRTTNRYGVYRLDIRVPSVDGVYCDRDAAVLNMCRASLIRSTSASCDVPGLTTTSDQFSLVSKWDNACVYTMFALSFGSSKKDHAICGK